jgi:hypothetical protein
LTLIFGLFLGAFSTLADQGPKNGGFALLQLVKITGANWSKPGQRKALLQWYISLQDI